jgi:D-glycero-alpha-D-manno-heptose-7-phosphate kinase
VSVHHADSTLAEAAVRRTGVGGVDAELVNDFPLSAGLGGSSAAGVAMLGALDRWENGDSPLDRRALAESSRELEVGDLGIAGGRQDHYAAAFGGALGLWFGMTTECVQIPLSPSFRESLSRRCIVAYTGRSRVSADTILGVMSAYGERRGGVPHSLSRMKALAEQMIEAVRRENLDDLGAMVGEHWTWQRSLHEAIPTPLIDDLLARATAAGAIGGKALGASGGGCVLAVAPDGGEEAVRAAMRQQAQLLDFHIDTAGFEWETST